MCDSMYCRRSQIETKFPPNTVRFALKIGRILIPKYQKWRSTCVSLPYLFIADVNILIALKAFNPQTKFQSLTLVNI